MLIFKAILFLSGNLKQKAVKQALFAERDRADPPPGPAAPAARPARHSPVPAGSQRPARPERRPERRSAAAGTRRRRQGAPRAGSLTPAPLLTPQRKPGQNTRFCAVCPVKLQHEPAAPSRSTGLPHASTHSPKNPPRGTLIPHGGLTLQRSIKTGIKKLFCLIFLLASPTTCKRCFLFYFHLLT